jgi:hypothetical protein
MAALDASRCAWQMMGSNSLALQGLPAGFRGFAPPDHQRLAFRRLGWLDLGSGDACLGNGGGHKRCGLGCGRAGIPSVYPGTLFPDVDEFEVDAI